MKTFAHLSASGAIQALVILDAPDAIRAGVQPEPDQVITEVESPELAGAGGDLEKTRDVLKRYKVAQRATQPVKLTRAE